MIVGSIARRYAKALFSLAVEQGRVDQWSTDLARLKEAISNPELKDVLENPIYVKDQRRAIAQKLAAALHLEQTLTNFLLLLSDRDRFVHLPAVIDTYGALADEKLGRIRARVVSAVPLDLASAQAISSKFAAATKAEVILDRAIDPEILGGVVAQVGSLVYDGSVRTQLEDLRRNLKH
jgi:F-type H+-transporting ATPase subunit delta